MPVVGNLSWHVPDRAALMRSLERFTSNFEAAMSRNARRRAQSFARGFCIEHLPGRLHSILFPSTVSRSRSTSATSSLAAASQDSAPTASTRVVFSLTTSPVRINRTRNTIYSLCSQQPRPARIVVALPRRHKRMPSLAWRIPPFLEEIEYLDPECPCSREAELYPGVCRIKQRCKVDVVMVKTDPGPALKLLGA